MKDIGKIGLDLSHRISIGRVEGHGNHGTDFGEVNFNGPVVVGCVSGLKFLIGSFPSVDFVEFLRLLIRLPDGGKAGGLSRHDVDPDPVVHGKICDAGSHELHDFVLHVPVLEDGPDDGQSDILGTHTEDRRSLEVYSHHARHIDIIGLAQELLHELRPALAHSHGAQGPVAGVGIGSQNHGSAFCKHLPGELVDDGLMRGYVDAPVLLGRREAEHVVVLIDGAANRAEAVVAVGQDVGNRELLEARSPRRLDNAYICNIVAGQLVELDIEFLIVPGHVVAVQNAPGHGRLRSRRLVRSLPPGGKRRSRLRPVFHKLCPVYQIHTLVVKLHSSLLLIL